MGAEVAGAGHDVLLTEGGAEEVRIHAVDVEGHSGVGLGADHVDFGFAAEKIVELGGVGEEVLTVLLSTVIEPVNGSAERNNLGPGLETGFENSVGVIFIVGGEEIVIGKDVVDHAATDERELKLWDEIAPDDHDAERGGIHLVGGETDGVGVGLFEERMVMGHGLGGVDDDNAFVLVDFLDELLQIGELAAVEIGGAVDDDEGVFKVKRILASLVVGDVAELAGEGEAAVVIALQDDAREVETLGEGHGREEGGVVLDVGGDDLLDELGVDFVQEEVETVGSIEREGDEVVLGFELEEFEDLCAGVGDELVGLLAPRIFDAFAAGIVGVVIVRHGVDDGLGAEALAGGVEVGGVGVEVGEVVHIIYYSIEKVVGFGILRVWVGSRRFW